MPDPSIQLDLARLVSAVGVLAHLSLASSFLGAIALAVIGEYIWLRRQDKEWLDLAKKFNIVATIFFGVGAAFGTLVEFGLVTIWSNFIAIIGTAIALPFFLELFAFLFEVIFLPLYTFTWNRISKWAHWTIGLLAAIGGYYSAYNILAVMSALSVAPPGLTLVNLAEQGKNVAGAINWLAAFQTPTDAWNIFWWGANVFIFHGILAAVILSWSGVAGVVLYLYIKEKKSWQVKLLKVVVPTIAVLTAIQGLLLGHLQGELVVEHDPLKLAALEGMFWSGLRTDPLTSFVAYGDFNHQFWGYYSWPADIRPPEFVSVFYLGFMVGAGILLGILTAGIGLYLLFGWFRRIVQPLLKPSVYLIPLLAALAAIGGAVSTESGRYPFILVQSVPSADGPPQIVGVPVYQGGLFNPTLQLDPLLAALIIIVEIAMPALAGYMVYLALARPPKLLKRLVEY
ncbi:cytochrome ubiquinol oxidase subunit I [Thermoproteus sp. CP80]|jgi:cytochrome d ubiquinol oxidase subunit I|uniref:cytochrome ubiquinol oxidase subunit I n=1 Tax=Thermoproteus sp. CP80 TaxID=1650659 RepID=UPI0009C07AD8|nr:cytochrome ubiquinol oxidase subunit I [Thermoproteus sp. CP80]PLC65921.1 cytochrome ubiquinol oxidase subunit I [Thermoproteus sp. CP80]